MNIEKSTEILKAFRNYNKFYKEENKDLPITITLEAKESIDKAIERLLTAYEKEKERNKELEKQYKILEVEKVRYNIQYLESSISQIPDTVMVYHSIKRDIETLKEQKIKLEKELQELLEEE